jgi:hypothetical protein
MLIPRAEFESLMNYCMANPNLFDPTWITRSLERNGNLVLGDAIDACVTNLICEALKAGKPYSVVRLGDGEVNLLVYGDISSSTPSLDEFSAIASIAGQKDKFVADHDSLRIFRDLLLASVRTANIVGMVGLWRPAGTKGFAEKMMQALGNLESDPRGISGQIIGRILASKMPDLVNSTTIFSSAHLYAGVVKHLEKIFLAAGNIVCITDQVEAVEFIRRKHTAGHTEYIPVGIKPTERDLLEYLGEMQEIIASKPAGTLFLIGAGPWAEIYCKFAKDAGSVGVDLGSGFDLLAGQVSRPVHRHFLSLLSS